MRAGLQLTLPNMDGRIDQTPPVWPTIELVPTPPPCHAMEGGGCLPSGSNDTRPSPLPSPTGVETQSARHRPTVGTVRHFGRPGAGVIRTWPPAIVPFEITDSEFNPQFVEHLAENGTSTATGIPLSVQARIYPYQNHFKTFVQNKAKEVLMSATLDVYSSLPVRGAPAAGRTLLDQDHVREQSDEFKLDYLPVGFISGDLSALASVSTEIRERLKHEQGAMRNLLLTMVHEPSGRPITHPVPSLTNLIIDVTGQGLCLVSPACSARESDGRTTQAARCCAGCLTTTSPLGDRLLGCTRYLHGGMLAEARRLPPSRDKRS
ncbi:hypothetical protein PGT21_026148 [Puccinia graminis f. sp. tritici]|uniref:Uncharacterized protein n=1 Tax=Puccinia graminis f. sp. tritici TaxID=56615 RepID=A0A5B0NGX5_PUCGR|nr:hypothetical protein PGT21_026148 [Puccinia graminis f. sp. tritici]